METKSRRYPVLAVLVALAVSLFAATAAHAEEPPLRWYENGTELTGEQPATTVAAGTTAFETHVSGTPLVWYATGVEAVGLHFYNEGLVARASGQLKFTGVSISKPANCTTASTIYSKALSFTVEHVGSNAYLVISPSAGEETGLLVFSTTGPTCSLKMTVVLKGALRGGFVDAPGTMASVQRVNFSPYYMPTPGECEAEHSRCYPRCEEEPRYCYLPHLSTEYLSFNSTLDFSLGGKPFGLN